MAIITAGELVYKITGDSSGLKTELSKTNKELKGAAKSATGFGSAMKSAFILAGGAMVASKIVSFFKDTIKAASNAEETASKFGTIFSSIAGQAEQSAKDLAKNYGLARTEAKDLLSASGDLITGFGGSQSEALKLSTSIQELAVDITSFKNIQGGAAFTSQTLNKALLGEREQLKALGIAISETDLKEYAATQGVVWKNTNRLEKANLSLALIQIRAKNSLGDYEKTSKSFANQQRVLNNQFIDMKENIGIEILPALRLYQQDMIEAGNASGDIGKGLGEFVGYSLLAFRIARDSINKWVAEFNAGMSKILFDAEVAAAKFLLKMDANSSIAKVLIKDAGNLAVAWKYSNDEVKKYRNRLKDADKAWDSIGAKKKEQGKTDEAANKGLDKQGKKVLSLREKYDKLNSKIQGYGSAVLNVFTAIQALQSAITDRKLSDLDATMEAELMAAGVAEETQVEQAQKEYDLAVTKGDIVEIEEKKRALTKSKIEEKYQKKKAKIEYEGALVAWQLQTAMATAQAPLAVLNAISAGWKFGPITAGIFGALAGAASAIQIAAVAAAKPQPPKFAEGGIVPGSSYSGDNVSAQVNSGEMVLNKAQQKNLFDMAQGGGGGGTVNLIIDGTVFGKVLYNMSQNGDMLIDAGAITTK